VNGAPVEPAAPRASVVIPTYNYAAVLAFSIVSVLDQTVVDFELLVVGDGCTDDSERVVTSFGDPRVQWVNLPRRTGHQVGPNNEGLRRARGEVVAYLGHDDLWLPNHLELLLDALDSGALVAHTSVLHAGPGYPCYTTPEPGWSYSHGAWIAPTSLAIRRADAVRVGGWQPPAQTGYSDPEVDLVARLVDVGGPPVWVPRVTCVKLAAAERRNVYRVRPTHEQEYWLRQIRESDDAERAVGAHVGEPYHLAGHRMAPVGVPTRAWRSVRFRVRKRLGLPTGVPATTMNRRRQRFKGVRR
jgi:glycosyltransferase involved in cell wall biosynthesis